MNGLNPPLPPRITKKGSCGRSNLLFESSNGADTERRAATIDNVMDVEMAPHHPPLLLRKQVLHELIWCKQTIPVQPLLWHSYTETCIPGSAHLSPDWHRSIKHWVH